MANKLLWVPESGSTICTLTATLAAAAFDVSSAFANATSKYRWAAFELYLADFAAAPTGLFELHAFWELDGSNYCDGFDGDADADSLLGGSTYVGAFQVSTSDNPQRLALVDVRLMPFDVIFAIKNATDQALATGTHTLKIYPYNEELQ